MKHTYLLSLLILGSTPLIHTDQHNVHAPDEIPSTDNVPHSIAHYKQLLADDPLDAQTAFNLANALYRQKEWHEAARYFAHAGQLRTSSPEIFFNLGMCYLQLKQYTRAIEAFDQALTLRTDYTKAYLHKAECLSQLKKHDEAIAIYFQALEHEPNSFDAHYKLAESYKYADKFQEAITHFRHAIDLQPHNLSALLQLANTLNMMEELDEALTLYQRILEINPNITAALYNYGYTLKKMNRIEEAIAIHDKVLKLKPDYSLAQFSQSLSYLTLGDWKRGWPAYESRWAAYNESPKKLPQPLWDGSNAYGKTIFLYAEQGLGDTYQFIRYAELVKKQGATVIVETQKPLKSILGLCPYIDRLLVTGEAPPACDAQLALMSLPMVFNTRIHTVPQNIPYLHADPELVDIWKERLAHDTNLRVGLCWQGNANYRTQALRQAVAAKSMHAATFIPLAEIEGVSFYSLQKVSGDDQIESIKDQLYIHNFGADFDNEHGRFMDTAAVMKNLDLVISVDTSTCHLAGGLGVPVWVMLPFPADWRWLLDRTDTPWYPTMTLYRQEAHGDWAPVIAQIKEDLRVLAQQKKRKKSDTPSIAQAYDTMTLDELAYHATMSMVNPQHTADSALYKTYEHHYHHIPSFQKLADELLSINKELYELDTHLTKKQYSVFDTHYMTLLQQAVRMNNRKEYVLSQIKKLQSN